NPGKTRRSGNSIIVVYRGHNWFYYILLNHQVAQVLVTMKFLDDSKLLLLRLALRETMEPYFPVYN
ncbi:MAG: hypothetical protein ACTSW1_16460, partial [Candidatus Hodarchaeales archaeon]